MSGFEIEIPLLKLKESVITKYFDEDKESFLKLFICKECQAISPDKQEKNQV